MPRRSPARFNPELMFRASAPKHYTGRSKYHRHGDNRGAGMDRGTRTNIDTGTGTNIDTGTSTGRQVRIHVSMCCPNSGLRAACYSALHNRIFEHKTPMPALERRTTGAAYRLVWKRGWNSTRTTL